MIRGSGYACLRRVVWFGLGWVGVKLLGKKDTNSVSLLVLEGWRGKRVLVVLESIAHTRYGERGVLVFP